MKTMRKLKTLEYIFNMRKGIIIAQGMRGDLGLGHFVCSLALSGCAGQRLAEQKAAAEAAIAQCRATIPGGRGNYVNRSRCINAASREILTTF